MAFQGWWCETSEAKADENARNTESLQREVEVKDGETKRRSVAGIRQKGVLAS